MTGDLAGKLAELKEGQDPWDELGVPTPNCPSSEEYCTLCEYGNYELERALNEAQRSADSRGDSVGDEAEGSA